MFTPNTLLTMKLSLLPAFALSSAAAFAPVKINPQQSTTTVLFSGAVVSGHDIRGARSTFAPGHFETIGSKSSAGRSPTDGESVREARATYAPFDIESGRVGQLGEIGFDSGGQYRRQYTPASGTYVQPHISEEFVPHSSTGAGAHYPVAVSSSSSTGPAKSYAPGSWKK